MNPLSCRNLLSGTFLLTALLFAVASPACVATLHSADCAAPGTPDYTFDATVAPLLASQCGQSTGCHLDQGHPILAGIPDSQIYAGLISGGYVDVGANAAHSQILTLPSPVQHPMQISWPPADYQVILTWASSGAPESAAPSGC